MRTQALFAVKALHQFKSAPCMDGGFLVGNIKEVICHFVVADFARARIAAKQQIAVN